MKRLFQFAAALVLNASAFAHEGEHHGDPTPWALRWTWEPVTISLLLLSALLYFRGTREMRHRVPLTRWQRGAFWAGWLTLVFALVSPIHRLGSELFSVHMGQHELLMLIAAPLLVMGHPLVPFLWALPEKWRVRAGAVSKKPWFANSWRAITGVMAVFLIHATALWIWHVPKLYEATLHSEFVHALQHTCFFLSALLFWWTLIHGRYGRMGYGVGVIFVWATAVHSSLLGALLTFSQQLWYPIYSSRTQAWNISPIDDQQLGGLIMWVPAGVVFIVVGLALFAAWLGESEKRAALSKTGTILAGGSRAS